MSARPLFLLLLAAFATVTASAHHILGIPHYKYSDDYPQIPFAEVLAQAGPWDLVFTHFPGFPKPGETVRFKLYIHDRQTDTVFRDPLTVAVVRKRLIGGDEPIGAPLEIHVGDGPEKNDYKFYVAFDEAEAYELRLRFPNGEAVETIPFPVTIGKTDDRPLVFGAAGILAIAIVTVAVVKRRRRRPRRVAEAAA